MNSPKTTGDGIAPALRQQQERPNEAEASSFDFTESQDRFSSNIPNWETWANRLETSTPRILEIGSWEGRSGVWMLAALCSQGGSLVCIDHFDLLNTPAGRKRYERVGHNLKLTGKEYRVIPAFSVPALMMLLEENMEASEPGFDWIYIDGSHEADDTFLDAELAWRLARKGAIFIFDDYLWDAQPADSEHHPKRGVDAFLALHAGQYDLISEASDYQVALKKTSDMRIGFVSGGGTGKNLQAALNYSINVALTVDSAYALAAAVAIRSAVTHTTCRTTFYVVDCGLSAADRALIKDSIPERSEISIHFIELPVSTLTSERGPTWAKVDMIPALPVERVLYLDADVLVRKDLASLWDTDLKGQPLGAVVDVGFPKGHAGLTIGESYFNAGVLLLNLAKVREDQEKLGKIARDMPERQFADQDVLNACFGRQWTALPLEWNAQGLGTYATNWTPERDAMQSELDRAAADPCIVHFTGPVHPPLATVLNPYVQPYTAKPWGYAGAPGHPFAKEWWSVLEQTKWAGLRARQTFIEQSAAARDRIEAEGLAAFRARVEINFG